jgi:predicted alpha/beta hydrolase family esterase
VAFLILHGWENHRPEGHWQRWLHDELVARGEVVRYPQLPDADAPQRAAWLTALRAELAALEGEGPVTVICHSLACALWLHAAQADPALEVDRLMLVAPPAAAVLEANVVAEFAVRPAAGWRVGARSAVLVASDADPFCPAGAGVEYGALGLPLHTVPGGGHLALGDGYGAWPAALSWALDGAFAAA